MTVLLPILLVAAAANQYDSSQWLQFDDWEVYVSKNELDPSPTVLIRTMTTLDRTDRSGKSIRRSFGFQIFGSSYYQFGAMGFEGKGYWPHCDFEFTSYAVDGQKASYFPLDGGGGVCEHITSGAWLSRFKSGNSLRLRVNGNKASASLKGFTKAWNFASRSAR